MHRRRILLTTLGSYGDLHPYMAIAQGLRARGHDATLATTGFYREKVEAAGIPFRALRLIIPEKPDPEMIRKILDPVRGPEFLIRNCIMPSLRDAWQDALAASEDAELLVTHPLTFATPLVAQKRGLPWVSVQLAPMSIFSIYDPPVPPHAPVLSKLRVFGRLLQPILTAGKWYTNRWMKAYHEFRKELNLPPVSNPLFEGGRSPRLELAIFSELLGPRQPDWPPQTVATGFAFYDDDGNPNLSPELEDFLNSGPAPLVFTLGSTAVMDAGRFYRDSAEAARILGMRAILLVGRDARGSTGELPSGVAAFEYEPYSKLFPRAAAIVHSGGVGTTGQAMRAGRPMLVMPFAFDQPDNADRVRRLGIAEVISRKRYSPRTAVTALQRLLQRQEYSERAAEVGRRVRAEDGVAAACDRLERLLA